MATFTESRISLNGKKLLHCELKWTEILAAALCLVSCLIYFNQYGEIWNVDDSEF